jgi:hypothetical protein
MQAISELKLKEIPIIYDNPYEEQERCLRCSYQKLVDNYFEEYFDTDTLEEIEEIYLKYERKEFSKKDLSEIDDANKRLHDLISDLGGMIGQHEYDSPTTYDYEPYGDTFVRRAV